MAIGFDTSASGSFDSSATSHTFSYTCGASATYLIVGVVGDSTSDFVTGVTYNSVAMSLLVKTAAANGVGWLYIFGLLSPATGAAHNIVISASSACNLLGGEAASYTGAIRTQQPDNSATNTGASGTSLATTLTPAGANCWGIQFSRNNSGTSTSLTGGTLRVSESTDGLAALGDSNATISGSTTLTINWTGSSASNAIMISLAPQADPSLKTFTGSLSFAGAITRATSTTKTASLSFVGAVTKLTSTTRTATLSFTGGFTRLLNKLFLGTLSFVGSSPTKAIARSMGSAMLSFVGSLLSLKPTASRVRTVRNLTPDRTVIPE